jgi:hypothetical protein
MPRGVTSKEWRHFWSSGCLPLPVGPSSSFGGVGILPMRAFVCLRYVEARTPRRRASLSSPRLWVYVQTAHTLYVESDINVEPGGRQRHFDDEHVDDEYIFIHHTYTGKPGYPGGDTSRVTSGHTTTCPTLTSASDSDRVYEYSSSIDWTIASSRGPFDSPHWNSFLIL